MLKSLQMKLVLILMLLVNAVMAGGGTFLINSVTAYNIAEFQNQVANFFQHHSEELEQRAEGDQPVESMEEMLKSYTRALGLSNSRNFYIVDGETGQFVGSSEEREDAGGAQEPFTDLTPNMITAMGGEVGQQINALSPYFDVAMPLDGGRYVFAVVDNKTELNDLTWNIFTILLRSLMFGLAVAIMFSFILARTITVPVQNLTKMATRIAKGDFSQRPQTDSSDEIGTLTRTFGEMAQVLETTLSEVNGERNKLNTLFLHMADGMVAFDKNGHILHMNPAAQRMLGLTFDPQMTYTQVFPNLNIDDSDLGEDGKYIEIDYAANKRILKIFLAMFGLTIENIILTVMLVCCGVMLLIFHYQPARTYDKSPRLKAVQHYEFSPEGITMKTASATSQVKWNLFSYYWDDVTGVYLLQNKKSYILLPARLFSSDDQRQALQQMAVEGNPDIQYKDFRLTRV